MMDLAIFLHHAFDWMLGNAHTMLATLPFLMVGNARDEWARDTGPGGGANPNTPHTHNPTHLDQGSSLEMPEVPSMYETTAAMMKAYLEYGPELAAQMWADQQKYMPKQAAMAYALTNIFTPKQMELQLSQLRQFMPQFQDVTLQAEQRQRDKELQYVLAKAGLLPQIRTAADDPATTAMRNTLGGQISEELAMGTELTPEQARSTSQAMRASEAARGLAEGQGSANRESVARALEGMDLQTKRQGKASGFVAAQDARAMDPFLTLLGRPTTSVSSANQYMAGGPIQPAMAGTTPSSASILGPAAQAYGQSLTATQIAQQNQMYALTYEIARQNALQNGVAFNV